MPHHVVQRAVSTPETPALPSCEDACPALPPGRETLDRESLLRALERQHLAWEACLHRYRLALYATHDVVFVGDLIRETFTAPEERWRRIMGRPLPRSFAGALIQGRSLCHPDDLHRFGETFSLERLTRRGATGPFSLEYRSNAADGWKWLQCTLVPVPDDTGRILRILGTLKDLDSQKCREETLLHQSAHDDLTDLCNRREGVARVEKFLAEHDIVAFAMVDLDNFKAVNDREGHHRGDQLLRDVACALKREAPEDAVVARLGGDEFLVAFPCPDETLACPVLERLIRSAARRPDAPGNGVPVTCSLGAAFAPRHGRTFQDLYEKADLALRRAKDMGKDTWCVAADLPEGSPATPDAPLWTEDGNDPELLPGDMVYLVDPRTFSLLYVNEAGETLPGLARSDRRNARCFQLIHGLAAPCPFCPNAALRHDDAHIWRCESSYHQRSFLVRSLRLRRGGREVCRHVITDITRQEQSDNLLRDCMTSRNILFSCIQRLLAAQHGDDALRFVLEQVGQFHGADRVCLARFLPQAERPDEILEWRRAGLPSLLGPLRGLRLNAFPRLRAALNRGLPEPMEAFFADAPDPETRFWNALGLRRAHAAYLAPTGRYRGFLGVGNPTQRLGDMSLCNGLSLFLASELEKRALLRQRSHDDFHDPHTGLPNRASFEGYLRSPLMIHLPCLGVAVADINALKSLNKLHGRDMGDMIIGQTAKTLRDCFPQGRIYRMDGDEFVVLGPGVAEQDFTSQAQRARRILEDVGCGVALGFGWSECPVDPEALHNFAHERMIWQKRRFYSRNACGKRNETP